MLRICSAKCFDGQRARPQSPRHTYRMMRPMTMPLAVSATSPAIFPAAVPAPEGPE